MKEILPTLPPFSPGAVDPSLAQGLAPDVQHRHEMLASRQDLTPIDLKDGGEQPIDIAKVKPLDTVGNIGLVTSVQLGGAESVEIWGLVDHAGKIDTAKGLIVTEDGFDPSKLSTEDSIKKLIRVGQGQSEVIGRSSEHESGRRFNLSGLVSRNHMAIELQGNMLTLKDLFSTNGSRVLVEEDHTQESANKKAIELKLGQIVGEKGNSFTMDEVSDTTGQSEKSAENLEQSQQHADEVPAVGEAVAKGTNEATTNDSDKPVETEITKPDLAAIFSSGHNFDIAMQDPANAEIMPSLREVAIAWKEVQLAATTDEVWADIVEPRLRLYRESLPNLVHTNQNLLEATNNLAQNMHYAAQALEEGDIESFGAYMNYMAPASEMFNNSPIVLQQSSTQNEMQQATNMLTSADIESDERLRMVTGNNLYAPLREDESERLVQQVTPMIEAGQSLDEIVTTLKRNLPEDNGIWRRRQQAIQEAVVMTNGANFLFGDSGRSITRVKNEYQLMGEELMRGRYDPAQLRHVATLMQQLAQDVEMTTSFLRHANSLADQIH
ncbi:MAG TPA: hypothetical protein VFN56_00445 [Candidatus Saccharimonadales bacterium]|nr:hypothetical protein [Candidatus Saccharimonadales bacterium]